MNGVDLIRKERQRQIESEGWNASHDDEHDTGELAAAAACYAWPEIHYDHWPWDAEWWKPTPNDPVRELVKAGALIAAEIDRLIRAEGAGDE